MADKKNLGNLESNAETNGNQNGKLPQDMDIRHDYEAVLHLIGFGKTQWIVLITAGLLLMMVINETMGMSILTIASQCDFGTTSVDKAVMSAAAFVGILISSYVWGYLSDTIGRRQILIYATLTGNCVSAISMFIPNYWAFVFLRFVVGIFIAGASSTTYAYLSEFFTTRHRPVVINYSSMFVGIANAYVPAVAWLVLMMDWSVPISETFNFRPWRLLIFFDLLPGLIAALVLFTLPESPKLLLARRSHDEALKVVDWICKNNTGKSLEDLKVYKLKSDETPPDHELSTAKTSGHVIKKIWRETRPLFKRPHVLNFLVSCTIMSGLFFSSAGMGLWYAEIQNRLGQNGDENSLTVCQVINLSMEHNEEEAGETICNDTITTKSYIDSITFGLSYIVGYIILGAVINPLGRKVVIIICLFISFLCGISLLWWLNPIGIVVCFCLFMMLPGLCISVMSGAVVDLVPTHLRGKAVCICLMLGRCGSIIGSNINGVLLESNCSLTFSLFSGFVFICAALTFILPI